MKSEYQQRAESLAVLFRTSMREPLVFEFSGSPKAGKTTVLNAVAAFLKRCGYKVEVVVERASVCPIRDKRHFHFNVWTACMSLTQMLERTQAAWKPDDPHIVILDRGIFDSICWMRMMFKLSRLSDDQLRVLEDFLLLEDWRKRLAGVIVMTARPRDSMEREKGHLPVLKEDGAPVVGSIMNLQVLDLYGEIVAETTDRLQDQFPIYTIDTSLPEFANQQKRTCEEVARIVLDRIAEQIEERILFAPRERIFDGVDVSKPWLDADVATELVRRYQADPQFGLRSAVEESKESVQAIPVAIIRDGSGKVLRLKRREPDRRNPLHERMVLWAGGHCREQDSVKGNPILDCLVRELEEELRLQVRVDQFRLVGAIYSPDGSPRGAQHVAIVFEWTAPSDSVALVLNAQEFKERRGHSQSGTFANVETIIEESRGSGTASDTREKGRAMLEPWTAEIIKNHLAPGAELANTIGTRDMFEEE